MNDIYCNPEIHGLKKIVEIESPGLSYEFNIFCVWRRISDGAIFYASDSGCSCPSPFEDYISVEKLSRAKYMQDITSAINYWAINEYGKPNPADVVSALKIISEEFEKKEIA